MGQRTAGDLMFEAYLRDHSYQMPEHEPDLGVGKRPDYIVERAGESCVCEVKEFDRDTASLPGLGAGNRFGSTDMKTVLKPIRSQIRQAASQLKPLADSGMPLVVIIANPHGAHVHTGDREVIWAMYGDPVYRISIDTTTGEAANDGLFTVDRNGKLTGDHQYVSAVAFVREREHAVDFYDELNRTNAHLDADARLAAIWAARDAGQVPEGSHLAIDVFKTLSPVAVPLPDVFFDGPRDRLFDHDPQAEAYVQIRGPRA